MSAIEYGCLIISVPLSRQLAEGVQPMKCALSNVREASPFATPPRVVVVADNASAGEAVALVEALEAVGADAEVRFGVSGRDHSHPDAVIVAEPRGYHVARHHPILERLQMVGG